MNLDNTVAHEKAAGGAQAPTPTLLPDWAALQPDKVALRFPQLDQCLTYGELGARAERAARWMIALGLQAGDGIALLLENRPELIEFGFAARLTGLYYTPVSTHLTAHEIAYVLHDCGARVLITSAAMAGLASGLAEAGATAGLACFMLDQTVPGFESCERALSAVSADAALPERPLGRDFLYSSGTTGLPKGVRKPLTPHAERRNPDREVVAWQKSFGFDRDSVYLSPAPLYHAAPLRYVMRTVESGGTCIVLTKFNPELALAAIEQFQVTHSQWVPTMFIRLLDLAPEIRARNDLGSMRVAIHCAAPCPIHVKEKMIAWWGPVFPEYYGGSEGIGLTVASCEDWMRHKGTVGRAVLGEIHIVDEDGKELPCGEVGKVYFAGGPRFEYYKAPEKTRSVYNEHGWATYGDLGHVDAEGFLYLSDRRADLIISGGVNVYPQEIENLLIQHPAVADAAVIGVPNAEFGEEVKAVLQLRPGSAPGAALAEEVIRFCQERLSGIKVPRTIEFEAALPRQENGKLLRRILKERYRQPQAESK